jgi:hypothetical protein
MPVPYRRIPRAAEIGVAAYLEMLWSPIDRAFYAGMLLLDGKGQPQEFVHNTMTAPSGPLWPDEKVRATGIPLLAHSLFDACRREPDLLVALPSLGTPEYCNAEISPAIPFAQVVPARNGLPAEWNWINHPPTAGMRAAILVQEILRRGDLTEPFERLRQGLRVVYPNVSLYEAEDAGDSNDEAEIDRF